MSITAFVRYYVLEKYVYLLRTDFDSVINENIQGNYFVISL